MENEGIPACQLPPGRDTRSVNLAHGINHQRFFSVSVPNVKCEAHCELQPLHLSISPSPGQFRKFQIYHITLPPPKKKSQFHHNETMGNSFKWKKKSISPRFLCRKKKVGCHKQLPTSLPRSAPNVCPHLLLRDVWPLCWGRSGGSVSSCQWAPGTRDTWPDHRDFLLEPQKVMESLTRPKKKRKLCLCQLLRWVFFGMWMDDVGVKTTEWKIGWSYLLYYSLRY